MRFLGFDAPMPSDVVELCIAGAHYPGDLKQRAREHRAHAMLFYSGYEASPLEQYVALGVVAAVLGRRAGLVVLNEAGHTSLPMGMLLDIAGSKNSCALLRELPLPYLYCGFVKHEVEGMRGVWMRTYGAPRLGLPDFAAHAAGHHEGQRYFDIFESVFRYVLESGARLGRGHTMQVGTASTCACARRSSTRAFSWRTASCSSWKSSARTRSTAESFANAPHGATATAWRPPQGRPDPKCDKSLSPQANAISVMSGERAATMRPGGRPAARAMKACPMTCEGQP